MNKAQTLLEALEDLTWENYVDIANELTRCDKHEIDDEPSRHQFILTTKACSLSQRGI